MSLFDLLVGGCSYCGSSLNHAFECPALPKEYTANHIKKLPEDKRGTIDRDNKAIVIDLYSKDTPETISEKIQKTIERYSNPIEGECENVTDQRASEHFKQ